MQRWNNYLQSLGLSENEAKIYLHTLKKGQQTVQQISTGTNLSRVTVYAAIDTLIEMGLISSVQKGKRKLFSAEPPERIVSVAETKVKKMENMINEMSSHLQELKLAQSGDKPVVKFFEGPEAYRIVNEDLIETKPKEIYEFGNIEELQRIYSGEDKKISEEIIDKLDQFFKGSDIKRRSIHVGSHDPERFVDKGDVQRVFLDKNKYKFYGDIFLYKNKIWLSSFRGKQISILIESGLLYDTLKALFDISWRSLKK
ncbi:MAG: hypothetical protein GF349_00810 [Candidatus Magasanikbacteria bacterium]|nr:hypothetical protein [Candidatus Magasanikbacteria bacterium]